MAVSRRLRYEILRRDNHQCRYCGAAAPDAKLTVDHVLPVALGGGDQPSNLVTSCADCNGGKSASSPDAALVEDVLQDQVRWGRAMALAVERRSAEIERERKRIDCFDISWREWTVGGEEVPRSGNWRNTVSRFLAAGLGDRFLVDAVAAAIGNERIPARDAWRYFCGICWREIGKLQELASQIVDEPADATVFAGPGVFPYQHLAESFIADLLEALDAGEYLPLVSRTYWSALEQAHAEFREGPGVWDSAEDRADEAFSSCTAHTIYTITRERRGSAGLVFDGP